MKGTNFTNKSYIHHTYSQSVSRQSINQSVSLPGHNLDFNRRLDMLSRCLAQPPKSPKSHDLISWKDGGWGRSYLTLIILFTAVQQYWATAAAAAAASNNNNNYNNYNNNNTDWVFKPIPPLQPQRVQGKTWLVRALTIIWSSLLHMHRVKMERRLDNNSQLYCPSSQSVSLMNHEISYGLLATENLI